ncbi:MAG: thioredoxin domain-containing protein [Planctomycetota bacterium]|nr:MAG: thioredoxin domain-containing protein [Planctomycetota bacterium]
MRSSLSRKIIWFLVILFSVAGMFISYDLTLQHLKIKISDQTALEWACSAFENSSCAEVSNSDWGRYPFGASKDEFSIPTAQLGLYYFTFVFCWSFLIGSVTKSRRWVHLFFTCTTAVGLGACAYLDYVMFFELDFWCPLCLTAHVASLLIFVCAALLWPRVPIPVVVAESSESPESAGDQTEVTPTAEPPVPPRHWPNARVLVYAAIIILFAVNIEHLYLGLLGQKQKIRNETYRKELYKKNFERYDGKWYHTFTAWSMSPAVNISTAGLPFRGAENARHTVVIFSDFLCPSCAKFEKSFESKIMPMCAKYGGIKVFFKNWPICMDCNPTAKINVHPRACEAAYAAEAALIVGGDKAFWKMYDLLWDRQEDIKKGLSFVELAKQIGLDTEAFTNAMHSKEVKERIRSSVEEGMHLGEDLVKAGRIKKDELEFIKVNSTPAIFVDGKRLYSPRHPKTWYQIMRLPPPKKKPPQSSSTRPKSSTTTSKPSGAKSKSQ